jgi:general secretion pathway protein J
MRNSGFTLLEVLLALTIFSIIALATSQQINVIRNTKETALGQIEQLTGMRSALAVIRDDLSQSFHIRYNDLGQFLRPRVEKGEAVPHTIFDGRKNQLIFTSLSHRNYYAGRKDSEQTEISYFLENQKGSDKNTLFKRESPLIDGNLFEGGTVYTLLENVTRLEFQFWDDKLSKWGDDWNSDAGTTRDIFPRAIKILVSAWDEKQKREITAETSFKVAFPNNQDRWVTF